MARIPTLTPRRRSPTVRAVSLDTDLADVASVADTSDAAHEGDQPSSRHAVVIVEHMSPTLPGLTLDDAERVDRYVGKASADATNRAYTSDRRIFVGWCEGRSIPPLPGRPRDRGSILG